jgi:hypothetical protein
MSATINQRSSNQYAHIDNATLGERITNKLDRLTDALADAEDHIQRWEELYGYVPDYVTQDYDDCVESLSAYAEYWGMDC